jgi:hypothetical protein
MFEEDAKNLAFIYGQKKGYKVSNKILKAVGTYFNSKEGERVRSMASFPFPLIDETDEEAKPIGVVNFHSDQLKLFPTDAYKEQFISMAQPFFK